MIARITVALLVAALTAAGLADEGEIGGLVQDATGAAIPSAHITVMSERTGIRRNTVTDGEGAYEVSALPSGSYRVTIRKPGFQTIVRWNVITSSGKAARLDFAMQVGSMREVITIEGGPAPMNTNDASVGMIFAKDAIQNLPLNGRGVMSLVDLSPGVLATPATAGEAGQFSASGLRANMNYFTVDGVSANTGVTGGGLPAQFAGGALPAMTAFGSTQNLAPLDALEEVRILTSSFAPQFGRLPGAQVALTTRSGSSDYHGSISYALRNEALDANDWFANARGNDRAALRLNQWDATFGGPVRKDRTFFFATYEGLRLLQPYNVKIVTPSLETRASAPPALRPVLDAFPRPNGPSLEGGLAQRVLQFSRPSRLDSLSLRIDHALTQQVSLFGRFNNAPSYTRSGYTYLEDFHLATRSLTIGVATQAGPAVTNDARMNFWTTAADSAWSFNPSGGAVPLDFRRVINIPEQPVPVFYGIAVGGLGALYSGLSGRNRQPQFNLLDTLTLNQDRHDLRFGVDYQRLMPARDSLVVSATGAWNSLADLVAGGAPVIATLRAEQASGLIENLSAFVQDTWRASSRLAITYGVRWELSPPPAVRATAAAGAVFSPAQDAFSFAGATNLPFLLIAPATEPMWRSRYTQFAPRAGAAFRFGGDSVLRAGIGIFYDTNFSTALDPINGFPFNRWQFGAGAMPFLAGSGPAFGRLNAPDLKLPHALEWNVSFEHMFSLRDVASIAYIGSAGRDLLRYEGVLQQGSRLAQFTVATNHGSSDYHGLEVQYRRRISRAFRGTVSYTWSHSIDNGSWDSGLYLVEPYSLALSDRAASSFDVRHNVAAGLSYALPHVAGARVAGALTEGWQVSGLLRARSGFPINILTTQNFLGLAFDNITRPDLVPGVPIWIPDGGFGGRRLNPAAFQQPTGIQGNLGRNAITGFGMSQLDLAIQREFPVRSRTRLEVRLEMYNALNHPNPADPVHFMDSPFFGTPVSMLNFMLGSGTARSGLATPFQTGGPRSLELMVRLGF